MIAIVAFLVYSGTLGHGFVFDDLPNIVRNRWIRSPLHLHEIFASHAAGFDPRFSTSYYRPMMHVFNLLVYSVAGLNPLAFHLVNVLMHVGVSVLAFFVSGALLARLGPHAGAASRHVPLVAALLFATHPVHTEAVAWLAGITDLSFSLFGLLCVLTYLRGKGRRSWPLAGLWLLLAALCKEPAVAIPLILVAVELAGGGRGPRWRMWPLAAAVAVYLGLRISALEGIAPGRSHREFGVWTSFLGAAELFARYLGKLLLPAPLSALHTLRPVSSALDPRALAGVAVGAGFLGALWLSRRHPRSFVGLAWIAASLLPALYIPALGEGALAERYLYFPSFGFVLLLALGCSAVAERVPRLGRAAWAAPLALAAVYGLATVERNPVWRDHLSLWSDTVRRSPESAVAHEYLCFAQYTAGQYREAAASCRTALSLDPGRLDARINLGNALSVLGDLDGAARELDAALLERPDSVEALTSRGLVHMAKGAPSAALESYRRALAIDPRSAEAHNVLGVALARLGRREEALRHLEDAVRLAPDNPEYRWNLRALAESGAPAR